MSIKFSKSFIWGQALFWGGAALAIFIFLAFQIYRDYKRAPFKNHLESYLKRPQNDLLGRSAAPKDSVAITGKLIVVNLKDNVIDPIYNDLPKELKPDNPEQVKTVLWIKCSPAASFLEYTDGKKAFKNECKLTFIDFINQKYLWQDSVTVSPPLSKRKGLEAETADPSADILQYLKNIPHKE